MGQSCSAQVLRAEVVPRGTNSSCLAPESHLPGKSIPGGGWTGGFEAPSVPLSAERFAISHSRASGSREAWHRRYTPRNELGHGVSANVFEADIGVDACTNNWGLLGGSMLPDPRACCGTGSSGTCLQETRRRVALKRFKRLRSRSFQTERAALLRVGAHPNIVRLLESYEDFGGEDVLVLEYCDGLTVFDVHLESQKSGSVLPELMSARILRQLLLALEHVGACGIEHQDVKPENMLLYDVSLAEQRARLKLGDFGWATPASNGGTNASMGLCMAKEPLPQEGAGSLWYAPPELNPPLEEERQPGCSGAAAAALKSHASRASGRADMWSVGVVAYVLLVGQNPFAAALGEKDKKAVEAAVLRLVAAGCYNKTDPRWRALPDDARDFVEALLHVTAWSRSSVSDALRHPFLIRRCARCPETMRAELSLRLPKSDNGAWSRMDGFQHLCWLAVARAVTEPEIEQEMVLKAAHSSRSNSAGTASYLWHLAREISSVPLGCWLHCRGAWQEVLRLAFSYIDVDGDGVLSAKDLARHANIKGVQGEADARAAANFWVEQWAQSFEEESSDGTCAAMGLDFQCFRAALRTGPPEVALLDCGELPEGLDVVAEGGDLRAWDG